MYKILVVDDEPKIREVIKEYGEFSGYEITEADDGITAVGLCKLNDYDLIIMDIMMPKLDGFSACKEIKKIKDIPVIMLSARGEEYDKPGVQHLLHLKSKSKILRPIEIMGFFYEIFCQIQENNLL